MKRLMAVAVLLSPVLFGAPMASASAGMPAIGKPRYEPKFEATACDGVVPADPRVECGVLTVPVDRDHPRRGEVRLPGRDHPQCRS
jgi:hypothetical protein